MISAARLSRRAIEYRRNLQDLFGRQPVILNGLGFRVEILYEFPLTNRAIDTMIGADTMNHFDPRGARHLLELAENHRGTGKPVIHLRGQESQALAVQIEPLVERS